MIFLTFSLATRLLKLKGFEDLIITRTNDKLTLSPPNLPSFSNQRIVIHNRILYFEESGIRYSLGMNTKDISVRLIESTSKVTYMSKKRTVDFFNLDKQESEDKKTESKPDLVDSADKLKNKADFEDPNEKFRVSGEKKYKPSFPKLFNNTKPAKPNLEIKEEKVVKEKKEEVPLIEPKQSHLIESDSTLEDCTHLTIKNVKVNEINSEFFILSSDKNCVTFFADKFIFAPCTKADSQQFAVYKIQEMLKKLEFVKGTVNLSNKDSILKEPTKNIFKQPDLNRDISSFNNRDTTMFNNRDTTMFNNRDNSMFGNRDTLLGNRTTPSLTNRENTFFNNKDELNTDREVIKDILHDENITIPNSTNDQNSNKKSVKNKISKSFSTKQNKLENKKSVDLNNPGDVLARLKSTLELASLDI